VAYRWAVASKQEPTRRHVLAWIREFPLFQRTEDGKLAAFSHPFAMPGDEAAFRGARSMRELLTLDGQAMDLVLDGEEIGSGSALIYEHAMQLEMLRRLGVTKRDARARYGFVLDALQAGAPPMTGFGLGVERVMTQLLGLRKIKDVMVFPKTKEGNCPVTSR
jgi:aspartyl-tRNA synthetase